MHNRKGEVERPWFRSERYYHTNEGWWSMTREESDLGPFMSQNEAKNKLALYIQKANMVGNILGLRH